MSTTYEHIVAEQRHEQQHELNTARQHLALLALEGVANDGFPRVSQYTVADLIRGNLIERIPGDNLQRLRLTPQGQIMLRTNPTTEESA